MLNPTYILYPVAALAALTFLMLLLLPIFRLRDSFARRVRPSDFKFGESDNVPAATRLFNRNYMNLLESPVLFYVICLIVYATKVLDQLMLKMAIAYVVLRVLHTIVHVTTNNVRIRLGFFAASVIILMAMWVYYLRPILMP